MLHIPALWESVLLWLPSSQVTSLDIWSRSSGWFVNWMAVMASHWSNYYVLTTRLRWPKGISNGYWAMVYSSISHPDGLSLGLINWLYGHYCFTYAYHTVRSIKGLRKPLCFTGLCTWHVYNNSTANFAYWWLGAFVMPLLLHLLGFLDISLCQVPRLSQPNYNLTFVCVQMNFHTWFFTIQYSWHAVWGLSHTTERRANLWWILAGWLCRQST